MQLYFFITILFILVMHEIGHILAAKILNLTIEKVGFDWKPIPRFYVSVIDKGIPFKKKACFLLSGNIMTVSLFLIYLIAFQGYYFVYYAFAFQVAVETNPLYSDYTKAAFSYIYKDEIRRKFAYRTLSDKNETTINFKQKFRKQFIFSKTWYLHFFLWGGLILLLFAPSVSVSLN